MNKTTLIICAIVLVAAVGGGGLFVYFSLFGAPQNKTSAEQFTIQQNSSIQNIVQNLFTQGFIKNQWAFN